MNVKRRNIKILVGIAISLIVITLSPSMLTIRAVFPQSTATLSIVPPSIIDPSMDPGKEFIVNATLSDVVDLFSWQINVTFNPAYLNCVDVFTPADSPFKFTQFFGKSIDNDRGFVMTGYSHLATDEPPTTSGSGILACIKFKVKGIGSSNINYSKPYGKTTWLKTVDPDLGPILITDVSVQDGYFSNWVPPPPAKLYVNPSRVVDPTLTPCNNFNVNISIINATDLYAWQLNILFPIAIINAVDVTEGPFLKLGGTTAFESNILYLNETHGVVMMSCGITSGEGVSGNGDLATIIFHVEDLGNTSIPIFDDVLYDSMGNALPHNTFGGYFSNILLAKLSVEPPEIIDPSLVPCKEFDINITIDDVEDLKICEFNLTYNTDPLDFIGAVSFRVLEQTPTMSVIADDEAGFVWIKLTYRNSITTYSPLPLVKITFHVYAFGTSPLNLTDTILKNSAGQPITHEVQHGYFASVIRDIAIIDVQAYPEWVYQGRLAYINVTVKNEGNLTETFDVQAFYDTTLIGTITVENLPPNENTTITFTWNTAGVTPCHNYTISAEAVPVPYETDLEDNTFTDGAIKVRFIGDINGDGTVDGNDITIVCWAYGSYPGHPRWMPEADVSNDELVDGNDITLVCFNYGKSCS